MTTLSSAPLSPIAVQIADMDAPNVPTFEGYTDGALWNGYECPWLPLDAALAFYQMLGTLDGSDERSAHRVDERTLLVGCRARPDYAVYAEDKLTSDGTRPLFYCGGGWTFARVTAQPTGKDGSRARRTVSDELALAITRQITYSAGVVLASHAVPKATQLADELGNNCAQNVILILEKFFEGEPEHGGTT